MREMMIDDLNDEEDEENEIIENDQPRIKWYLIDTDRNFCKCWNFLITLLTIYNLVVTPLVMVFPDIYQDCIRNNEVVEEIVDDQKCDFYEARTTSQSNLVKIEIGIDVIYIVEILFCFVKKTLGNKDLRDIALNYITGYFFFDAVSVLPLFF